MNNMWKSDKQIQNELLEENSSLRKQLKQYNSLEVKLKDLLILTVEMLMRDKIHLDERRNEKINELLSKR